MTALSTISTGGAAAPVLTPNAALDPFGATMTATRVDLGATSGSSQASCIAEIFNPAPSSARYAKSFQFSFWARTVSGTGTLYPSMFSWWDGPATAAWGIQAPLTETWQQFTGSITLQYGAGWFGLYFGPISFAPYYYGTCLWQTTQPPAAQSPLSFYMWGLTFTANSVAASTSVTNVTPGVTAPISISVTDAMTGSASVGYQATLSSALPGCTFTQPAVTDSSGNATGYITAVTTGVVPVVATGQDGAVGGVSYISGSGHAHALSSLTPQNTDGGFAWTLNAAADPIKSNTAALLSTPTVPSSYPPRHYNQVYFQPTINSPVAIVSFWARADVPGTQYFYYQAYTYGGGVGYMEGIFSFSVTTDWQQFSFTYVFPYSPAGSGSTNLIIGFDNYIYGVPPGTLAQGVVPTYPIPATSSSIWGVAITYPDIVALSSIYSQASVGASFPVSIHVTDQSGTPVAGYQATLTASLPGCTITQPSTTDSSGNAVGYVSCPIVGNNTVTATGTDGAISTLSYVSSTEFVLLSLPIQRYHKASTYNPGGGKANATPLIYNPWWN